MKSDREIQFLRLVAEFRNAYRAHPSLPDPVWNRLNRKVNEYAMDWGLNRGDVLKEVSNAQ